MCTRPRYLSVLSADSAGPPVLQHTGPERSQGHKARLWHSREVQSPGYSPFTTLQPLLPPRYHMVFALLEPPRILPTRSGTTCVKWNYCWGRPQKTGKILQTSSKASYSRLVCSPGTTLLRTLAQADSAHTRSIQKFLVHTVTEAAEQAIGPHHALLQILAGDGIIRIPLLYLTAEGKGSHSKNVGNLPGPKACMAGKHGLPCAMALG